MPRPRNTVVSTRANRNETNSDHNNQNEANTDTGRENRLNFIFIDGDENEERRMVTLEEFLQYASDEPEWLYEKLQETHQQYDDCLDDHKVRLAEEELQGQTKDGEITLLRRRIEEIENVRQQLAEVKAERDAFGSQIARLVMDDSLEEFFRLPDAQDHIPIDPAILANHWPWEDGNLQQSVPQADSLINSEMTCSYPDPPPVLHSPPNYYRGSSEKAGGQNGNTQTSDHSNIHDHQLYPSQHSTDPDASYSNGVRGDHHVGGQSKSSKRKTQQPDGRARKRLQVPSMLPSGEDSFTTLHSHFMSAPLDDRLQFLSWLFEGALPHCMSSSSPIACEERDALAASCSSTPHEIEQNQRDHRKARGGSRKNMPWSTEEAGLLLKLRKEESRSWSEVARLFSESYPGRTLGAIQVHWSTTLNKKAD